MTVPSLVATDTHVLPDAFPAQNEMAQQTKNKKEQQNKGMVVHPHAVLLQTAKRNTTSSYNPSANTKAPHTQTRETAK